MNEVVSVLDIKKMDSIFIRSRLQRDKNYNQKAKKINKRKSKIQKYKYKNK